MARKFMVYKVGRGWYAPKAQGYRESPIDAGLFDEPEARRRADPREKVSAIPPVRCVEMLYVERAQLLERLRLIDDKLLTIIESVVEEQPT